MYQNANPTKRTHHGEREALSLFHAAADRVPAYKDFLKKHNVDAARITTIEDFEKYVPIISKKSYVAQYPLADLCFDGTLAGSRIVSGSSGSSGEPFFWPRGIEQDREGMEMFGEVYDRSFSMNTRQTLLVVCFSMGTWIAGTFTMTAALQYISKGRPVNVVTPGIDKVEAVKAVKRLGVNYEQVVLIGYPPIVKDIIELGTEQGVDWKALHTKLFLSSEAFSEQWRDYALELIGSKNPYFDTASLYGSADAGIFGVETPASIIARRLYDADSQKALARFGREIVPTLVQYDPARRYFEQVDGELIFTAPSGLPLVRYNTEDEGGVVSYADMIAPIKGDFEVIAQENNVRPREWQRPFLYVHGRKLFVVTIYGVNVYPENIKAGLLAKRIRHAVSGRFTVATKYHKNMDQYLEIHIEMTHGTKADAHHNASIKHEIFTALLAHNGEFNKLYDAIGEKVVPHIHLHEFGDPAYFSDGAKHKWVET